MATKSEVAQDARARIDAGVPASNVAHLVEYPHGYDTDEFCQYLSTDLPEPPRGGIAQYRTLDYWASL